MRNLKRFLALALTMLMVIGSFSLSAKSFADTADMTAEQINALDVLSDLSIFIGKEDGTFGGAEEINRKEMAILASRIQTGEKFGASYGENVTPFADVVSDFEAILYASNMGIVIGFEDGTFRPDDKVIYQDVLTMIVRTLGYNGAAMDAGYPSTYINKARELGITKGITSTVIPSWTSNVARQDVATLLYNALFAVKADGTTAAEFFGIDTYVVTAVEDYNLTGVTAHLANGTRVVVQPLNADGSINDMYYHIPVAAFEAAGLTPVHGASYRIASTDNMETVKAISALPSIELADDADMTAELYAEGKVVITGLDGKPVTYTAVERYTKVYNNQGTQKADNEIIVYNQRGFNFSIYHPHISYDITKYPFNYYKPNQDKTAGLLTDANGNLLDQWGYVVAYFVPEWVSLKSVQTGVIAGEVEGTVNGTSVDTNNNNATTTINGSINGELTGIYVGTSGILFPYAVYDAATGTYAPATEADIAKAAQAQDNSTVYHVWTGDEVNPTTGKFVKPDSSFVITNKDDKYTAVAYDDNADGKYDRLAFMYHSFAEANVTNGLSTGTVFTSGDAVVLGDGRTKDGQANAYHTDSAVTAGELVRFYSDAARATAGRAYGQISTLWAPIATVVEKYETTTVSGLVTAVNGTKMTIGGKVYDIATMALHNFKDMVPHNADTAKNYIGQNVTAVLYDGGIYSVKGYENTWVIFEDYTGLTTNGYVTALAFSGSSELKNITIASVDGYFFLRNNYNIPTNAYWKDIKDDSGKVIGQEYVTGNISSAIYGRLETGSFYSATKDAYGYYHITTNTVATPFVSGVWTKFVEGGGVTELRFVNNRSTAFTMYNSFLAHGTSDVNFPDDCFLGGANAYFTPGNAPKGGQWEWIFFNPTTKTFQTGKGFPTEGSKINFAYVNDVNGMYNKPNGGQAMHDCIYVAGNVVYFSNGTFTGSFNSSTTSSTPATLMTDLVLIDAAAAADYTVDNVVPGLGGAGETIYGFRYVYNKALSLSTGKQVSVATDGIYNYKLEPGVYAVVNNVIDRRIYRADDSNGLIACATLYSGANGDVGLGKQNGFGLQSNASYSDGSQNDAKIRIFENKSFTLYTWNCDGNFGSVFADWAHWDKDQGKYVQGADGQIDKYSYVEEWAEAELNNPKGNACRVWYVKGSEYTDTPVFFVVQNHYNEGRLEHWTAVGGK